jgi:hypothetical protein
MELRPLQKEALVAAYHTGGLAGMLAVGSGKTLVASLIPSLWPEARALILAKAGLVYQGSRMMQEYSEHFSISDSVKWMSYDFLSRQNGADILFELQPDIIIADEAQCLANPKATRTMRFLRYMEARPETKFFFLSGTITRHSIRDFAHLMELAFGDKSPLPRDWITITEWSECLDSDQGVRYPGKLHLLTDKPKLESIDEARLAVSKRIKETLGVVSSSDSSVASSITISKLDFKLSDTIRAALRNLEDTWERPDGEPLVQALDIWRIRNQMMLGGYYRWTEQPPRPWIEARRGWFSALREFLNKNADTNLDSPMLVTNAVERGELPHLAPALAAWKAEALKFPLPPIAWEWIDKEHLKALAKNISKRKPSIVWTRFRAPSHYLAKLMEVPYFGANEGDAINFESGERTIVASINAHKEGRNLQNFSRNILVSGVDAAADFEQLLGRTHRAGQMADTVELGFFEYLLPDMKKCMENAKYLLQITGNEQKILIADKDGGWDA